tara:strand:+ start:74112 stop:75374 length:1263 start_codon:yes stop_codon:yes gene_type:complete
MGWSMATCIVAILLVAGINGVVDPYLRFEWFRIERVNAYRPKAVGQVRMAKAYQIRRVEPRTVVLGNSRVDLGIDPQSKTWPANVSPVYNAGQPGGGMWANLYYLRHAAYGRKIDHVVLGVDFFDFFRDQSKSSEIDSSRNDVRRLLTDAEGRSNQQRWKSLVSDTVRSIASISAMCDSALTVASQSDPNVADIGTRGLTSGEPFRPIIWRQGQRSLVDEKNADYRRKLQVKNGDIFDRSNDRTKDRESADWDYLDELIGFCDENEIRLTVFLHPYHAELLQLIDQSDRWRFFDDWKRELVVRCERSNQAIDVWDFACVTPVTSEPIPQPEDRDTIMRWYWESGHYRREAGELILACMFGDAADRDRAESLISGKKLDPQVIEKHLSQQRTLISQRRNETDAGDHSVPVSTNLSSTETAE